MANPADFKKTILEASGVEQVIWIDDFFFKGEPAKIAPEEIIKGIRSIVIAGGAAVIADHPVFTGIDFEQDEAFWVDDVDRVLCADGVDLGKIADDLGLSSDLSKDTVETIQKALETDVKFLPFSLTQWNESKDGYLAGAEKTLFLVDKDFSAEGGKDDEGVAVIAEIISRGSASRFDNYCVLFSYAYSDQKEAEEKRKQIFAKLKGDIQAEFGPDAFSVLSKSGFSKKDPSKTIEEKLPAVLKDIFARKVCSTITWGLRAQMIAAIEDATDAIFDQDIYELDTAIFHNSLNEGASELELLHRIFHQAQKSAAHHSLIKEPEISRQLRQLRDIEKAAPSGQKTRAIAQRFIDYRNGEIWDAGEVINSVCSPISNGDVFQWQDRKFVLLAQVCDLTVRKNGTRKPYPGMLVELLDKNLSFEVGDMTKRQRQDEYDKRFAAKESDREANHYQLIEGAGDRLKYTLLDFRKSIVSNLNILDWAVYNDAGLVELSPGQELHPLVYLEGWRKRFSELQGTLNELKDTVLPNYLQRFTLCYEAVGVDVSFDPKWDKKAKKWDSGLKRIGRLRDPYAEHALAKYFEFRARKAFDHDFAAVM